jgi:hypothetical protein
MPEPLVTARGLMPVGKPWLVSGAPDPDFDDRARRSNHMGLTDPDLAQLHSRRYPDRQHAGYDDMIRALGYVWECAHDAAVNVTGYRCAVCGARRLADRSWGEGAA